MKKIGIILTIFILTFFTFGCTETKSEYQTGSNNDETSPATELVILDSKLEQEEYGGWIITGTAQTNTDISYAEVDVKFYDAEGAVLQSGMTNVLDLAAGEKWNFKVYGPGSDVLVKEYKIATSITP